MKQNLILLKTFFKQFREYYRMHMWFSFVSLLGLSILIVIIIMQSYLKHEYTQHLQEKTYATENSLLLAVNTNIKWLLKDFIRIGAKIAVTDEIYELTNKLESSDEGKREILKSQLNHRLSLLSSYSQWIVDLCIASDKGVTYQLDKYSYVDESLWLEDGTDIIVEKVDEVFLLLEDEVIPRYVMSNDPTKHPLHEDLELFHIAYPLKGEAKFDDVTHSIIVSFDAKVLNESLATIYQSSNGIALGYLTDRYGRILFHSDKSWIGKQRDTYLADGELTNISEPIGNIGWVLNISIDENSLMRQVEAIYNRGILFYILMLFIICLFMIGIVRWVQKPVNEIRRSIIQVKKGNMCSPIIIEGQHEIWQLADEYNNMIETLRQMNERVIIYNNEKLISLKKQQRAEREVLESQINAHFIFNTLAGINYDIIESGNHKVSIQIKKLSNILRYTFEQNQDVYMFQEIAWIEQYLFLQKSRLEDVFVYSIDMSEEVGNWPCRKLMLQPFVENSIIHGFEGIEVGGIIEISIKKVENRLQIIIQDNGIGMDEDVMDCIHKVLEEPIHVKNNVVGIGISNVITRMQMYYGTGMDVKMETKKGKGTRFEFLLPQPIDGGIV